MFEREVRLEDRCYQIVLSDKKETLLAAKAAGRVIVGLLRKEGDQDLSPAKYLVETPEAADAAYLERVVRREQGLPWRIGESKRLILREFSMADVPSVAKEAADTASDAVFYTPKLLQAYLDVQYRFYEYGVWAVIRKSDGKLIGKAGVTDCTADEERMAEDVRLELGYHVFEPYRNQGYATEACQVVLDYVKREWERPVYASVEEGNRASAAVLKKLGFTFTGQRCSQSARPQCLYVWSC